MGRARQATALGTSAATVGQKAGRPSDRASLEAALNPAPGTLGALKPRLLEINHGFRVLHARVLRLRLLRNQLGLAHPSQAAILKPAGTWLRLRRSRPSNATA